MIKKQTKLPIKGIERFSPQGLNDACDEMVNIRYKDGAWRPIGPKEQLYDQPPYDLIDIHKQDNVNNWIGFNETTKNVEYYNPETLSVNQIVVTLNATETLNAIRFQKLFMLVITNENLYRFRFKDTSYTRISLTGIESRFTTLVTITDIQSGAATETATDAEGLLGKYFKLLSELSNDSKYIGGLFYRIVIKLFDGTQILHTIPAFHQIINYNGTISKSGSDYTITFSNAASIKVIQSYADILNPDSYNDLKDVINSVTMYASQNQQFYEISEETITDDNLNTWLPGDGSVQMKDILPVSDAFQDNNKMYDSVNWWKIGEIKFTSLVQQSPPNDYIYSAEMEMDLKDYYSNFATRETINIDNFTHHDLTANGSYIYNDRLTLGDTLQTIGSPESVSKSIIPAINPIAEIKRTSSVGTIATYEADITYEGLVQVVLNTSNGTKVVESTTNLIGFKSQSDSDDKAIFYPGLIGYFDSRAIEFIINIKIGGVYYELYRTSLNKSEFWNYAYAVNDSFDPEITTSVINNPRRVDVNYTSIHLDFRISELTGSSILPVDNTIIDNNRVQASEVNNPFVFPAENSQQVSIGVIRAFGTNTEAMGTSQFGQYPLYCFTSVGIWMIEIGTSDIYFTRVVPGQGEVVRDNNSTLDLSFGVCYISSEGLRIVSGNEIIELSTMVEGLQDESLSDNPNLQFYLNHASIVQMLPYIDKIPFLKYIEDAVIGYNKGDDNNEIIVSNPNYSYSYIYDLKHKYWTKLSGKILTFIPNYPELYAVNDDLSKVVNISNEVSGTVQCLMITRATSLGDEDVFKKLQRTFIRCRLSVAANFYAAGLIFKSDDLKTWEYVTGNDRNYNVFKDIWITHSKNAARFYSFVFAATINFDEETIVNRIDSINCISETKRSDKPR